MRPKVALEGVMNKFGPRCGAEKPVRTAEEGRANNPPCAKAGSAFRVGREAGVLDENIGA